MGLLNLAITYVTLECGSCGTPFALSQSRYNQSNDSGKEFYCPNGHKLYFVESEKAKLEKQLATEKKRREWAESNSASLREEIGQQERKVRAYKGVLTKTKKRVGNGICPCCNRTFQNLMNHMNSEHPEYKK